MATFMASLHQRAATPSTPTPSPHPSLHSRASVSSHPKPLSLHEYRKQLSSPCTSDLAGSKRVKRKSAASSLKTATHASRVTFVEPHQPSFYGKGPPVRNPLADESQPLLGPPSPESPVLDPFCRTHSGDVRLTSPQDASNLLERPLGFAKKLASRKRLPRPDNIKLAQPPLRYSLCSDPSSVDLLSSSGLSESSTFTLSKYPFPLPPSGVRFSNVKVLPASPHPQQDISLVLPDTPPATPATFHCRGASFDLVNPRQSLFNSNFEPPEDPDLETGNELVDRLPLLKGLLPGDMAGKPDGVRKDATNKSEPQSRKIFNDLETAYASIAQQKAHGSRDTIIQSPQRRMASVDALTSPPARPKPSAIETPRSVSAGLPASTLSSPSKTPRGPSFMDRVRDKLKSPLKSKHDQGQELEELNADGTPIKSRGLAAVSEEALLHDENVPDDEVEVEDRASLDDSAWESISERPTEPRYSLAPSSLYPESRRASRPYSLAASSIYQDSGLPPNSAFFGPISNRRSVPWGVRNKNTDYTTEMSMTADMWQYGSPRNSLQPGHNDTTLGSIIDRYGNDITIGRPTGSSIAASFDNSRHDSLAAGQDDGIARLRHVHTSTPDICVAPEASTAQLQDPGTISARQSPAAAHQLPRLQTNVAEFGVGAPPTQSPPPLAPIPQQPNFTRGSTELLSGQGSYGDTHRLLSMFPSSGSPVSEFTTRHLSPPPGDGLPESPLQSIIDQCSAQSSPMEREDPFYLEAAASQDHRDSWVSCSTNSSGGGILGEAGITFEKRSATPDADGEHQGHEDIAATGDIADEIPAIWNRKVSPCVKSQRALQIDEASTADVPATWARQVSPSAKSQQSPAGQLVQDSAAVNNYVSPMTSPADVKGKQTLRRKASFEQLSPSKSVAADLIPKRTDTNPWRNKKKSAATSDATDSPMKTPGKDMPRFPRESQLFADSVEGDLSRAFPTEDQLRAGNAQLHDPQWTPLPRSPFPPNQLGHGSPQSARPIPSPHAPLLPQRSFEQQTSSPVGHALHSPYYPELRSPTSSRTPLLPGHRQYEHFYSPTADGIDAALSAPSTMAAVFPSVAGKLSNRAVLRTPSRQSNVSSPSIAASTGDRRLDEMREMRRQRPRGSVHYDETLAQRRLEQRRRISEGLDGKVLPEPPKTSPKTDGRGASPRAAVRSQKSHLPLRLGSNSAMHSNASAHTRVRRHRRTSDIEAGQMPWWEQGAQVTPTTVGHPGRCPSPCLTDRPRPEYPVFDTTPDRQEELSWKIFWIFGLFAPFGLLIYTGHFDVLMPYLTENEVQCVGKKQKKAALGVAIGECVVLLFIFWVLKMVDVV
ncbi:hypothetical protein HDK90DRAFT_468336 [Phyllosticta capitalensis]|uniref:Uncharacterized protein n=1 Tax=Phyllosticta capitalensis TaxID=121624 RepID=A0ABR1YG66_9PEZI